MFDFTPFPTLTTPRLELRQIVEADIPQIFLFRSDPKMIQYLSRDPFKTMEEAVGAAKIIWDLTEKGLGISWGLSRPDDPILMGAIGVWKFEERPDFAEIGYELYLDYQNQGFMYEAMSEILNYCINTLKFKTIKAVIDNRNIASQNLVMKSGFVKHASETITHERGDISNAYYLSF